VLVSFLCAIVSVVRAETAYYPLLPNIRYEYRVKATAGDARQTRDFNLSAAITTMKSMEFRGKTVIPQKYEVAGQFASLSFVTEDKTGVYYFASQRPKDTEPELTVPLQYLIRYPVDAGTSWIQKSSEFELINNNHKLAVALNSVIESTAEVVTVPSGTFANCLKVKMIGTAQGDGSQTHLRFSIEKTLWYAPGVGMVKSLQRETRSSVDSPTPEATFTIVMLLQEETMDDER
jgi:hypothetical protein